MTTGRRRPSSVAGDVPVQPAEAVVPFVADQRKPLGGPLERFGREAVPGLTTFTVPLDEAGLRECGQVLGDRLPGHGQVARKLGGRDGLPLDESTDHAAAGSVGQGRRMTQKHLDELRGALAGEAGWHEVRTDREVLVISLSRLAYLELDASRVPVGFD